MLSFDVELYLAGKVKEKMKYLYMDIYEKFKCIGGSCPDSCCVGWNIPLNRETIEQYEKMQSPYRDKVLENIECTGERYRIKMGETGRCPFLNEQNLCNIYIHISPEAMFPVCQTYPRKIKNYYDTIILTLFLSCPEVCRMLLERKDYIHWEYAEDDRTAAVISPDWQMFNELINSLIISNKIASNDRFSVRQKAYLLLRMAELIQGETDAGNIGQIRQKIQEFQEGKYEKYLQELQTNAGTGRWESLYDILTTMDSMLALTKESKEDFRCFQSIKRSENERYKKYQENYYSRINQVEYTNLMLTYLLQYYMDSLKEKSIMKNMLKVILTLILLQNYEMLEFNLEGEVSDAKRIALISHLARIAENTGIMDVMADRLLENNQSQALYQLIDFII